jgi:hypothetical protein
VFLPCNLKVSTCLLGSETATRRRTSRFAAPRAIALGDCRIRLGLAGLSQRLENDAEKGREDWKRRPDARSVGCGTAALRSHGHYVVF